jgi:hypothetical protein
MTCGFMKKMVQWSAFIFFPISSEGRKRVINVERVRRVMIEMNDGCRLLDLLNIYDWLSQQWTPKISLKNGGIFLILLNSSNVFINEQLEFFSCLSLCNFILCSNSFPQVCLFDCYALAFSKHLLSTAVQWMSESSSIICWLLLFYTNARTTQHKFASPTTMTHCNHRQK